MALFGKQALGNGDGIKQDICGARTMCYCGWGLCVCCARKGGNKWEELSEVK